MRATCELCRRYVLNGNKYSVDIIETIGESRSEWFGGETGICRRCAKDINKKIETLRSRGLKGYL